MSPAAAMFEAFVKQSGPDKRARRWKRLIFVTSFAVHGVLLVAATAHSFWHVEELTSTSVTVTFLAAVVAPPPPPPPPAAAKQEPKPVPKKPRERPAPIVQPPPEPTQPTPAALPAPPAESEEAKGDESEPAGEPGGVPGGVAGGIAPPGPPRPAAPPPPVNIAPNVGAAHRLTDLNDPRFRPSLPPSINRPGMSVWGVFRICVSANGQVEAVNMVKSADPLVDNDWMAKIRTWRYRPYSVDGRPVPFCHPARIVVNSAT
jgi:periplasmic protein TonB